jgi:DNA-binding response OmpR family regulator
VARVVLANFDAETAAQLIQLLQRNRHSATQLPTAAFDLDGSTIGQVSCDLIILDVSCDDCATRAVLTEILRRRAESGLRPMLLCVTRAYRGPRYECDLERKGARLAYVS